MKDVFRLSYCNSGAYSGEGEKREKGTKTGSEKKGETGESVTFFFSKFKLIYNLLTPPPPNLFSENAPAATAWVLFLDLMVLPLSPPPL